MFGPFKGQNPGLTGLKTAAVSAVCCPNSRSGYKTPRGGWERYDIHHIKPREFGGGNDFWNLVPVEQQMHQDLFNSFWRDFIEP